MRSHSSLPSRALALGVLTLGALAVAAPVRAQTEPEPLRVCATTPTLGALVRALAGDEVELTVFCKPTQDPHFLRAMPSFVKALSRAELLCIDGLELEIGWLPALVDGARNGSVRPGARGHFDASSAITPIQSAAKDRSAGDVHALGNPHFLVDPLAGLAVARALATKLGELRPARAEAYERAADALTAELGTLLFGESLATTYDVVKLGRLHQAGRLGSFLAEAGGELGGLLGRLARQRGARVVADHDGWAYLLRTAQLETAGYLEPYPGVAPSTGHLGRLVESLRAQPARALIHVPYFERGPVEFVREATGIPVVTLAHQVGAQAGTGDYVAFVRHNLSALADALESTERRP